VSESAAGTAQPVVRVRVPERSFRSELRAIKVVWRRELIRFKSDRMRIVTALVQPLLFLFVLGTGLETVAGAGTHGVEFKTFIYPGILCMSVMFTAMFSAASIVWDREFGFLREMMVAPVRRSSIVLGKCLGGATGGGVPGRDRARAGRARRRALRPDADPGDPRAAAAARVLDHGVRRDGGGAGDPDAVVHGAHPDGDPAHVLHLGRDVPRLRAAGLAGGAETGSIR
jgi:ABC-2 type transporter